jgi:pimeloyl-ACP methyl ester carboxylesterase
VGGDAKTLLLRDGRTLGYAEQGDPAGAPVLLFHGLPGSRLSRHPDGSIAARLGLRVISIDRPGIGLSTPKPGRTMLDWPRDVEAFADALGLERLAVAGWSGGGPYALATAHELPERIARVGLVASVAPLAGTRFGRDLSVSLRRRARVARALPWIVRAIVAWEAWTFSRDPDRALDRAFGGGPACDRVVLADPDLRRMLIESRREAYRQGAGHVTADALLLLRSWGFDPRAVRAPVRLWHGEEDGTLAPAMGRSLAALFADCETTFFPGEGHMVCVTRWEEILRGLAP